MEAEPSVWLADLTHTSRGPAADAFPYGVGCLAEYLISSGTLSRSAVRVLKFPRQVVELVAADQPAPLVVGFTNYMWNSRLSLAIAARIADRWPRATIVFGGPHYPLADDEREDFLRSHPQIDFYVEHEGEQVLAALVGALLDGADPGELHNTIGGLHSIGPDGAAFLPPAPPRLPSLDPVPSPYVSGLLEQYFTGALVPLLETNRGCPFKCTFCSEGVSYYNRVTRRGIDRTRDELHYIGERLAPLVAEGEARNELILADSNFGMFTQDQEVCEVISECQSLYGWPAFVNATTGKNRKDQVLLAIQTAGGALELTGSVQTLDQEVLKNIKRANIRTDVLMDVVLEARRNATGTYSEVILGLPGDRRETHVASMKELVRAGFDSVRPYQLCFLPGTEVASKETRHRYGLVGRFRVLPRCFGAYDWLDGDVIRVTEVDEICVAQETLPFEDYLSCRVFDLFVHLFHNDGPFAALEQFLTDNACDVGDWIDACLSAEHPPALAELVDDFVADTKGQLYDTVEDLTARVERSDVMAKHIAGELGNNVLHTYRGRAFADCFPDLARVAEAAAARVLDVAGVGTPSAHEFVRAAVAFHAARCEGVLADQPEPTRVVTLDYDISGYLEAGGELTADSCRLPEPRAYLLSLSTGQQDSIAYNSEVEAPDLSSRGRLLARTLPGSLWRSVVESEPASDHRLP